MLIRVAKSLAITLGLGAAIVFVALNVPPSVAGAITVTGVLCWWLWHR